MYFISDVKIIVNKTITSILALFHVELVKQIHVKNRIMCTK